jgi:hypothetical protein
MRRWLLDIASSLEAPRSWFFTKALLEGESLELHSAKFQSAILVFRCAEFASGRTNSMCHNEPRIDHANSF